MDKLFFTQNNEIAVDLHDIAAESAFMKRMELFKSSHPFTKMISGCTAIRQIVKPSSLADFNDFRTMLELFVAAYPQTEVIQIK